MKRIATAAATAALLFLAACESSEERAEKHFQSAMSLMEAGDVDRAVVELRNVIQLDENHTEARRAFAEIFLNDGNLSGAYGQYLWLVEQSPEDFESLVNLAEIAARLQNWDVAESRTEAAQALNPDDLRVRILANVNAYRRAAKDDDVEGRRAAITEAEALVQEAPDNILVRRVLIDGYLRSGDEEAALAQSTEAIRIDPEDIEAYRLRLALLSNLGDEAELETQLLAMYEKFPEEGELRATIVRYYLSRERSDDAEAFLRSGIASSDDPVAARVELIQFVVARRGADAGLEEIETAIAETENPLVFRALRAGLIFDKGEQNEGIAEMEAVVAEAEGDARLNEYRLALSRMLSRVGNDVGARRLVEEILENDPSNIAALKDNGRWLIDQDRPADAVSTLRTALDNAPQDVEAMTLMAEAYERNGERALARDMLSLAVEASNAAPAESLRYAETLARNGQEDAAEEVLVRALRLSPGDIRLLRALGQIYISKEDFPRAAQVEATLRRFESEEATNVANELRILTLSAQDQTGQVLEFLDELAEGSPNAVGLVIARARTHLASGDAESAISVLEAALEENAGSPAIEYALASTRATTGDFAGAQGGFERVLDAVPNQENARLQLMRVLNAQGKFDEASAVLSEGLDQFPESPNLLWARATELEQDGDIEGAIEIYEALYARFTDSAVIANNLASLLATYRDDDESLQRAVAVSRRLRDVPVPAFQDTYGWIAYRTGDLDDALSHLEPAAEGLPEDPIVQYHLGMVYLALDRSDVAAEFLRRAIEAAGPADTRDQIRIARDELARLSEAAPE